MPKVVQKVPRVTDRMLSQKEIAIFTRPSYYNERQTNLILNPGERYEQSINIPSAKRILNNLEMIQAFVNTFEE